MSRFCFGLLGLAAAGLTGVIGWELKNLCPENEDLTRAVSQQETTHHRLDAMPSADPAQSSATILARPLFSRNRRPPSDPERNVPASSLRLSGILISPAGKWVIFAADHEKPIVAREGVYAGPYLVQSIMAGRVTVSGPAGERVLVPMFDPKVGQTPAVQSSPFDVIHNSMAVQSSRKGPTPMMFAPRNQE